MTDYFGPVSELVIKENFVIVYELLEEMLDYGNPYITDPSVLKDLIPPPSILSTVINAVSLGTNFGTKLPSGAMSSIPWRSTGIKYTNNEIFVDLVEEVDAIIDRSGKLVTAEVRGEVQCNSRLSGMPELILSFLNHRVLEDCMVSFHPCVRYHRFEKERILSFVPPDGQFKLMDYNVSLTSAQTLPVYIKPTLFMRKGTGKLDISFQPRATGSKIVESAVVSVTLPSNVSSVKLNANLGQCSFDQMSKQLRWTLGKVSPEASVTGIPLLTGQLYFENSEEPQPNVQPVHTITVDFKINMHTCSGLRVDSLQLHHEPYKPYKGVRSVTKSGRYQIRV
ncbi:AP-3 complex subunit mu-2 [Borealophlyctis nickersoniae]|nr:AP-3 complex subunit mu-2 [Borealophlyctis nickersoniae]